MEMYIGLGVLALFIGIFAVGILLGKKRKKALKRLADTLNFSFRDGFMDEDDDELKSLNHLDLFRQTRSQGAWNMMRRSDGDLSITIMDHRFSSGSGKNVRVSEQTVIVFQSSLLRLPKFTLRHDDPGHQLSTALLGYKDIDFNSHPAFSKRYHLHGIEEDSIRHVFSDEVLDYFERHGDLIADGSGDSLVFCRLRKTVAAKDIKSFLEQGFEVLSLFKPGAGNRS